MEWISVKDRLPDTARSVLIYDGEVVAWSFFNSDKNWVDCGNLDIYRGVTHWMELPPCPPEDK